MQMRGAAGVALQLLLEPAGAVDDARQATGQHGERRGDTGKKEYRCDRRLDQTGNIHGSGTAQRRTTQRVLYHNGPGRVGLRTNTLPTPRPRGSATATVPCAPTAIASMSPLKSCVRNA